MGTKQTIKNIFSKILNTYKKNSTIKSEKRNIKALNNLYDDINLTPDQVDEIQSIWKKNYGKEIDLRWNKLYMSYTGKYDKYYYPEIFFTSNLINKLNPLLYKSYYADKVLTYSLFGECQDIKLIDYYGYNCNGFFYSKNGIVDKDSFIKILYNIGEVVVKPTLFSSSGRDVRLLSIKDGIDIKSGEKFETIINKYDKNYIIQKKLEQSKILSDINSSSVNTLRFNSYICDGKVYLSPTALRIGRNGNFRDNLHAGGIMVGVNEDGTLMKYAFYHEDGKKYERHPDTGFVFEGYKIPKYKEISEFVKNNHYRVPHIGIIAWDITLDKDENIVLIETNITTPSIWLNQIACGKAFFGENTEKMIRKLRENN